VRFQGRERADFISAHQAGVARDISCEDSCKPTFDPRLGHSVRSGLEHDFVGLNRLGIPKSAGF
jgi:hypothetical protein